MLRYLATDPGILGLVTWAGLFVTVAGFWIAIAQVSKVKKASDAANEAVVRLSQISSERHAEISSVIGGLGMLSARLNAALSGIGTKP